MKNCLLFLLIILCSVSLYSQEEEWNRYEIDSIFSVKMPGENIYILDTITQGKKMRLVYTTADNSTYIAQRILIESNSSDKNLSNLPHDKKSLLEYYEGFANGISKSRNLEITNEIEIELDSFSGMKIKTNNSTEFEIFILNNYAYSFNYINNEFFDLEEKDFFFNSKEINKEVEISQYKGKSKTFKLSYLVGYYTPYFLVFIIIVFVIYKITRKK
ncbi:hypothetical protein [Psychroserpens algicola]|uniref:hypothetical protein n=1 Tax=Psychroserpens algicola TaxID=1719034 RepID=UPI0019548018|nr:hypothetical protein [Psychroserpens algicola]